MIINILSFFPAENHPVKTERKTNSWSGAVTKKGDKTVTLP